MFAFKKNKQLYDKLETYFAIASETMVLFQETIEYMINNGFDEHFDILAGKTCKAESNADDVRRQIESEMFENALLPETREDILLIIEMLDRVPTEAKEIVRSFMAQKILPAKKIRKQFLELLKIVIETYELVIEETKAGMGKSKAKITDLSLRVDNNESLGDGIEHDMISRIFELDMDTGDKLLQQNIVKELGALCDLCEAVTDRIVILYIKRQI